MVVEKKKKSAAENLGDMFAQPTGEAKDEAKEEGRCLALFALHPQRCLVRPLCADVVRWAVVAQSSRRRTPRRPVRSRSLQATLL